MVERQGSGFQWLWAEPLTRNHISATFPQWQASYLSLMAQRDLPTWGLSAKPAMTDRLISHGGCPARRHPQRVATRPKPRYHLPHGSILTGSPGGGASDPSAAAVPRQPPQATRQVAEDLLARFRPAARAARSCAGGRLVGAAVGGRELGRLGDRANPHRPPGSRRNH